MRPFPSSIVWYQWSSLESSGCVGRASTDIGILRTLVVGSYVDLWFLLHRFSATRMPGSTLLPPHPAPVPPSRSGRMPREPLDALTDLPKQAPRRVALTSLQVELSRMPG